MMNCKQKNAVDIALSGHNLLIIGPAGTGKSFVVNKIHERFIEINKCAKITCSTGIACSVYKGACTINRFLGLHDGRYDPLDINKIQSENAHFSYVEENLRAIDCLIVDECSMISKRTFDTILTVCSRKPNLQLIFCGDFLQLPPVANIRYKDYGHYCFESELFAKTFPHRVLLSENIRTTEPILVRTITDIFNGEISNESVSYLQNLRRPLVPGQDSVKLFSLNTHVDHYNRQCLLKFSGDVHEFKSVDSGEKIHLDTIKAPHILWLKTGCPVILLQNLSDILVNGLRGHVHSFDDGPVIKFDTLDLVQKIPRAKFTVFSPSLGADIAVREQYPLSLAFGLTIHKAQGMTLDRVEIDCRDIFRPGQLGVALSRASTTSGLRVINWHPRYIMKPAKIVTDFLNMKSTETLDDMTCCPEITSLTQSESRMICESTSTENMETEPVSHSDFTEIERASIDSSELAYQETEPENTESDEEFDKILESIVTEEGQTYGFNIPEGLLETVKKNLIIEREITSSHIKMNALSSRIDNKKLQLFVKKLLLKMNEFIKSISESEDQPITKGIPECKLNKFYRLIHEYNIGLEYKLNCIFLFETEKNLGNEHLIICYKILETVRLFCIERKADLIQKETSHIQKRFVTSSSKARIRYVAGYCVSKLRRKYVKKQKSNMFTKCKDGQNSYYEARGKLQILNLIKEEENILRETTSDPDSLLDIENRQGVSRGLTNVTDSLFYFFLELTEKSLNFLIHENLLTYGKDMYTKCLDHIYQDKKLEEMFSFLVQNKFSCEQIDEFEKNEEESDASFSHINNIFKELTEKYVTVLLAQFRKDVKSSCKLEKKMAHRKQIKVSSKKKSSESKVGQCSAPKKRKSMPNEAEEQPSTSIQCEPQPSTSKESVQESLINDEDSCKKCFKEKDDEWIQCDSCDGWFHRKCAGLKNRQWKKYNKEGTEWFCSNCK